MRIISGGEHLLSSHNSSQSPLPLLETLYLREHGNLNGSSDLYASQEFDNCFQRYCSDTMLQNDQCLKVPTSDRNRACSVSPNRSMSLTREAVPVFIDYLKQQKQTVQTANRKSRSRSSQMKLPKSIKLPSHLVSNAQCTVSCSLSEVDHMVMLSDTSPSQTDELPEPMASPTDRMDKFEPINRHSAESIPESLSLNETVIHQDVQCSSNSEGLTADSAIKQENRDRSMGNTSQTVAEKSLVQLQLNGLQDVYGKNRTKHSSEIDSCSSAPIDVIHRRFSSMNVPNVQRDRCSSCWCLTNHPQVAWNLDSFAPLYSHNQRPALNTIRRHLHIGIDLKKIPLKPPMILVFAGDNAELFEKINRTLLRIVADDTYVIYHLTRSALVQQPWISREAACFIVADTKHLDDACWSRLQHYFNHSGKILFLCQNHLLASLSSCASSKKSAKILKIAFGERQSNKLGKEFESFMKKTLKSLHKDKQVHQTFHAKDPIGGHTYSVVISKTKDSPLLLYMENVAQRASALFSDATNEQLLSVGSTLIADALERLSIQLRNNTSTIALSPGFLICSHDRLPWDMDGMYFNEEFGGQPKILIRRLEKHGSLPEVTKELLPVELRSREQQLPDFDANLYFSKLDADSLGKALFYVPVCESTQQVAKSLAFAMPNEPIVVVARQQISGRGRDSNQWISPVGCATFSFNYTINRDSQLASNVGFIQHIVCVAVVDGIRSLHERLLEFPIKIKWPNDLYYNRTHKLGGLIVNATNRLDKIICTIVFMNLYETEGQEEFLKHYYRFWLHSREVVTISDTDERAVIRGLDKYGYLEVRSRKTGQISVVHPDGNTFDMMKGLIIAKYR